MKNFQRILRKQAVFVGQRRGLPSLQWHRRGHRRGLALREIDFFLGKIVKGRGRNAEVLRKKVFVRQADPVADAEGAEFGKVAVVENEDKMTRLVTERFDDVAMTTRKIPNVTGTELVRLGIAGRIDHCGADESLGDKAPLRRGGMPVQFTHDARLHAHGHPGDAFGNRQLRDSCLLAVTAAHDAAIGFLQFEFESRKFCSGGHRIGNVVLEGGAASIGADGIGRGEHKIFSKIEVSY